MNPNDPAVEAFVKALDRFLEARKGHLSDETLDMLLDVRQILRTPGES